MIRLSAFLVALFACTNIAQAAQHLFTSTDGKTLIAEIVSATPDVVTLKLENGTSATLPITRLAEQDRLFVSKWREANPADVRYHFVVDWEDERIDNQRFKASGDTVQELKQKWVCHFKIFNRSSQSVDNLQVRYQIFYLNVDGKSQTLENVSGMKELPLIKSNETLVVDSEPVELQLTQLKAGWVWADGSKSKEKDDIKGVIVTLMHNGRQVHEFASRGMTKPDPKSVPTKVVP